MAQYHFNPVTGEVGQCRAVTGVCPFGEATAHHASAPEARAAYEALQALPPSLKRRLTQAQLQALVSYQGGAFLDLNYGLRMDEAVLTPRHHEIIEHLDGLFEISEEEAPEEVYRVAYCGKSIGYLDWQLQPGDIIEEHGYLSTTESEQFVEDCLDHGINDEPVNTVFTIQVPAEAPCLRPARHTYNHDHEEEVLFPRNLRFEVVEDDQTGSRRYITLKML